MTGYYKKHAETLYSAGYEPLPLALRAKWPDKSIDAWTTIPITREQVHAWSANGKGHGGIGIRTGEIVGVDIDIYDAEVAAQIEEDFVARFGQAPKRIGQAPKCLYVFRASDVRSKITSAAWARPDAEPGEKPGKIEILAKGQQFVAINIHPDTGKEYTWPNGSILDLETWELPELDMDLVADWVHNVVPTLIPASWEKVGSGKAGKPVASNEDAFANYKPPLDITEEEVREYLTCLDPNGAYEDWLEVMMACHHQFGGSDKGYEVFAQWSRSAASHNDPVERARWAKMHPDSKGARLTFATVIKRARETDAWKGKKRAEKVAAVAEWERRINGCADQYDVVDVCKEIAQDETLIPIDKAKIADSVQTKLKGYGVKMPIGEVRTMIYRKPTRSSSLPAMEDWCEPYVWCVHDDCFIEVATQQPVTVTSFNAKHGRDVKGHWMTPDGFQMAASQVALQELQIPVIDQRMYLPWADRFFDYNGMKMLNSYRPSSVPDAKPESEWDDGDREAVAEFENHVHRLLAAPEAKILLDWAAYCVQKPGDKIKWSILIKGIQGDGKSYIGEVLRAVMGVANVITVGSSVLKTDFNGWAEGHCLCLLEELRMAGHNRHDILNALKELHTNDIVSIHKKKENQYSTCNTQNYLAFTNHADALPLDDVDRRWCVMFSLVTDIEDLGRVGMDGAYFERLFNLLTAHIGALRTFLLSRDLVDFKPKGRAPHTDAKDAMIATAAHDEDEAIKEVIETGIVGVSKHIISTGHLTNFLLMNRTDIEVPKGRGLAVVLSRLGFHKVSKQVWWKGYPQRVWVKQLSVTKNAAKVKELLGATDHEDDALDF